MDPKEGSRYNLRPRKSGGVCGKVPNRKHQRYSNFNCKVLINSILPRNCRSNFQCKLEIDPIIPLDSHLNFNCKVNVQDLGINVTREIDPVTPIPRLVERESSDHLQGVTGFEDVTKNIDALDNLCGDGSLSAFSKCTVNSCMTCSSYKPTDYFYSTVTHRLYKANNREWPSVVDCYMSNFIYLITCNCCNFQYVGETSQTMINRSKKHRCDIKAGRKNTYLVQHFNTGRCLRRKTYFSSYRKFRGHCEKRQ